MNYLLLTLLLTTADLNANTNVQSVSSYLQSLPNRPNHKVLSGQFIGYVGQEDTNLFTRLYDMTEQYPALMSTDYAEFNSSVDVLSTNMYLINQWYNGGLVEVSAHFNNPTNNQWNDARVDWTDLLRSGTTTNTNFNHQLDRIIVGLKELQKAGVVVLFRPLMEPNGTWFWWGGRDREEFVGLWDYVFKYVTRDIHNLLWVYSVSAGYGQAKYYFPGIEQVDVVGLDVYSSSGEFEAGEEYYELLDTKLPIALTELGQCRSSGLDVGPKMLH